MSDRFLTMNYGHKLTCGDLKKYNKHMQNKKASFDQYINFGRYDMITHDDTLYSLHQYLFTNYAADTIVRFIRYRYRIRKIEIQKELQKILIKDLAGDVIHAF